MQNGPIDKFTALTATIFMTISARLELLPGCPVDHKAKAARLELLPGWGRPVGARLLISTQLIPDPDGRFPKGQRHHKTFAPKFRAEESDR